MRTAGEGADGYSLVEVLVSLVILEVGLLGAAGLVVSAGRAVASAVRTETALTLAEAVADSLLSRGWNGGGELRDGAFVVSWSGGGGSAVVEVRTREGPVLVRIPFPVGDP